MIRKHIALHAIKFLHVVSQNYISTHFGTDILKILTIAITHLFHHLL